MYDYLAFFVAWNDYNSLTVSHRLAAITGTYRNAVNMIFNAVNSGILDTYPQSQELAHKITPQANHHIPALIHA